LPIAAAIAHDVLLGLEAAHEACDDRGEPLHIVHRDVSPQNLIVGADGVPRVLDFGVAKAASRLQTTREGQLKGKIPYMSPEQLAGEVTAKSDVYSASLVLWEALTRQRLFRGETEAQVLHLVMTMDAPAPSTINPEVPPELDAVVLKGLARDPAKRYASAREMAAAIESCTPVASAMKIAEFVASLIGSTLAARDAIRAEIESGSHAMDPLGPPLSTPALPGFPQVDASGPSLSSVPSIASFRGSSPGSPAGIAESTASLVVAAQAPARSRLPLVLGGLGVALVVGVAVAVGIAYGRSSPNVSAGSAATSVAATTTSPPVAPAPTPSATPKEPPTASAAPAATESVAPVATHKHVIKPPPHATAAGTKNPNDIDTLLDTR